jgi:methane monooxygenase PmoA-like
MKCAGMWSGVILLALSASTSAQEKVAIRATKSHIDFLVGDEQIARYQIGPKYPKPIFWPVLAPGGVPVTRAWPMEEARPGESKDHPHQKSAWFCHGDVIPEGLELKDKIRGVEGVDFWSEAKGHGRIVCTRVEEIKKPGLNGLNTHNTWETADGTKILDEDRRIFFYNLGKARLIVLDIDLHASAYPITFGDTKEGAMGIRINDAIRVAKGKGKIQNAEGQINEKGCWGKISAWCDYSGPIDGKVVGLAVLCDPKNAYPSCWHSRDYGLMAANPFGRKRAAFPAVKGRTDLVRIARGDHLHFRYGILVHEGDAETGRVAEHYQQFVKLRTAEK